METLAVFEHFGWFIDKLIDLLATRSKNKRALFTEIIEPLFNELQLVVDEYFLLFWQARELARMDSGNKLEEAVERIKFSREKILKARAKTLALVSEARKQIHDKKVIEFCERVSEFFFSSCFSKDQPRSSHASQLIELLDYLMQDQLSKEELQTYIDRTLENLQNSWIAICQSYAALRIRSLKP